MINKPSLSPAPSVSRTVTVNGLQLHYLDYALDSSPDPGGGESRPVMLCIHGGAAHAHWFDFVADAFTDRYRVLSLDLRGHGDSEWAPEADYAYLTYADDVAKLIKELGLGPVVLVGHSMGGMVSLVTAARYPEAVSCLVVIDSMMQMTPERASTLRDIGSGKGRTFPSAEAFVDGFKIRPNGTVAEPHVVRHMALNSCRQDEAGAWFNKFDRNVYARRHPIDGYDYWAQVTAPVLLVAGGDSDRITAEVEAKVRGHCSHVEVRIVEDAGHHVTLDNPLGYRRELAAFLATMG